jgi:beta-phosphoglucomutase-like phosphatase (HAD superfamily)
MKRAVAELGLQLTTQQVDQYFRGRRLSDCAEIIGQMLGHAVPDHFLPRLVQATDELFVGRLQAVAGVAQLLGDLRARRATYCVASSGTLAKVRRSLELTGLLEFFMRDESDACLLSGEAVRHGKPAPDLFLHAARIMGYAPSACAVIEDSPAGVTAAVAAGMSVYGYAPGGLEQRRALQVLGATVVETMAELRKFLL